MKLNNCDHMENYIYVLKCNNAVKIGKTSNIDRRIREHKSSNPFIILVYKKICSQKYEKYLHRKLKSHLIKGATEWFEYYDGIIEDIDSWLSEDFSGEKERNVEYRDVQMLIDMKTKGFSNIAIGKEFGVTEGAVRKWLKKYNINPIINESDIDAYRKVRYHNAKDYKVKDVIELKESGYSITYIASIYDMSEGNVRKILKKNIYEAKDL